jgi:hypothetical protein
MKRVYGRGRDREVCGVVAVGLWAGLCLLEGTCVRSAWKGARSEFVAISLQRSYNARWGCTGSNLWKELREGGGWRRGLDSLFAWGVT